MEWTSLIGVAIGWLLSELSWHRRSNREERQLLSQALSALLFVYFDRVRYRDIMRTVNERLGDKLEAIYKEPPSDEGMQRIVNAIKGVESARKIMGFDPETTTKRTQDSVAKAIQDISKVDAVLSLKVRQIIEDREFFSSTDMNPLLASPMEYLQVYESMLSAHDQYSEELKDVAVAVARKLGPISWLRVLREIRSDRKQYENRKKMISGVLDSVEKVQQLAANKRMQPTWGSSPEKVDAPS